MVGRDPALVVALGAFTAAGSTGRLVAREGSVGIGGDGSLAALLAAGASAGLLGLREERLDPSLVDKVQGRAEEAGEEQIQEDAVGFESAVVNLRTL